MSTQPDVSAGRLRKFLTAVFLFLAVVALFIGFLPQLAERFVLPEIIPPKIADQYRISIYRLGLDGCTLKVSGIPGNQPYITTGTVQLGWSLSGLRERRLDALVLDGVQVVIPEQDSAKRKIQYPAGSDSPSKVLDEEYSSDSAFPPFLLADIRVVNSTIIVQHNKMGYSFPVGVKGYLIPENQSGNKQTFRYAFNLFVGSQDITAELVYNHPEKDLSCKIASTGDLSLLVREMRDFAPASLKMEGGIKTRIAAELKLFPFRIAHLEGNVRLAGLHVGNDRFLVQSDNIGDAELSFSGTSEHIKLEAQGLHLARPLKASVNLRTDFSLHKEVIGLEGMLDVLPDMGQQVAGTVILTQTRSFVMQMKGEMRKGSVQLDLTPVESKEQDVTPFTVNIQDTSVQVGRIQLESHISYHPEVVQKSMQGTFTLRGNDLAFRTADITLHIPGIELQGADVFIISDQSMHHDISGAIRVTDASLDLNTQDFHAQGINLQLPFSWPAKKVQEEGGFQVADIIFKNNDLGAFDSKVVQVEDQVAISGKIKSIFFPEDEVTLNGAFDTTGKKKTLADFSFSASNISILPEHFSGLFPAMGNIKGKGLLGLQGRLNVFRDRVAGSVDLDVKEGYLEIPDLETRLEGIRLAVDFPELPKIQTSPRQELSIGRLQSKKIVLDDIESSFRLESPDTLYVENVSADWGGGKVFTSSIRLQKENRDAEVALICDRLNLAEVLTQLGLAKAKGEGEVSGRIPLRYEKGSFYVDNGFLFSTPGESGTLKIKESEHLIENIPQDVPQFSPIHLAGAALKDFKYNWAKLLISSEAENLMLKLQIDGKPSEKLPYRFDTQKNAFLKLGDGETGGIDQQIILNVNFNVPLNELLRYNKELQNVLQNFRE